MAAKDPTSSDLGPRGLLRSLRIAGYVTLNATRQDEAVSAEERVATSSEPGLFGGQTTPRALRSLTVS